ncbi:carbamate kinase [Corynebacterium sp. HMSC08C04]|uniref:carbamate kinase n=1 Tax=Corynebacterium sp. HMSC08C04 TaxID=1581137 RepID=UPI0008A0FB80|nr:carbamate kinase [Corynebacterium sp. HMSC08C04]OFT32249.1 carbamate kinase [Corynebacterium sp. HMSC08C04]
MDKRRVVVALGGNALGNTPTEQLEAIRQTADSIVDLIEVGHEVVVTHGNGPQVGMIKVSSDFSHQEGTTPEIPFAECGAMSEGYIGYHLQQAIENVLRMRNLERDCYSLITQTVVDENDPAFDNPTKPIGVYYSEEEAKRLAKETGNTYVEDSGRGWRWVIASPLPIEVVEAKSIANILGSGGIAIAAGGGGIPVVRKEGQLSGVTAVIDKDRTAALIAQQIEADTLLILTAVDYAYSGFNTPEQKALEKVTVDEVQKLIDDAAFAPGSMLPKVEACLEFARSGAGRRAIITSLEHAGEAMTGSVGTVITS